MRARAIVAALCFVGLPGLFGDGAQAQGRPPGMPPGMPMGMPDPSQMSGIPRPDATVPHGRLTVRVLHDDFAHPMIGQEVILDGPGGERRALVDATAHAVFDDLVESRGAYTVRATAWGTTLTSQPIEMPADSGVKIMLVFQPPAAALIGEHDNVARLDPTLPAGTIAVSIQDADGKPLAAVDVVLAHAQKGTTDPAKVDEKVGNSDEKGELRFTGLAATVGADAYLVTVAKKGLTASSQPFRLEASAGTRLGLRALALTRDATQLTIGRKSHIILEVKDETVEVVENLAIENGATEPFDPGPAGLVFELPEGAQGAQIAGDPVPGLTVEGNKVVYRGTIKPGEMAMPIGFVLEQKASGVHLQQKFPARWQEVIAVTDQFDGMQIEGAGALRAMRTTPREQGGRKFFVMNGSSLPSGEVLDLQLSNLPHRATLLRDAFVALAALLFLWFLSRMVIPSRLPNEEAARLALEAERDKLLDEAASFDDGAGLGLKDSKDARDARTKRGRRQEETLARLEKIYRQLDHASE